jgi:hypothetical protein
VTLTVAVPPAGIVAFIWLDANVNAGSATCIPLKVTGESPKFCKVTAVAWDVPIGTLPNDTELGLTVSGRAL